MKVIYATFVRRKFTAEEFVKAADGDTNVRGPDDLTFGGYCRLLENKKAWEKLGLNIDRKEFVGRIDTVRRIRNEIMHFSPDEHEPADIEELEQVARFLRRILRAAQAA